MNWKTCLLLAVSLFAVLPATLSAASIQLDHLKQDTYNCIKHGTCCIKIPCCFCKGFVIGTIFEAKR